MSTTTPTIRRPLPGDTDDVLGRARAEQAVPSDSWLQRLVRTDARLAPTVGRLGLGIIMLPHALQKTLGWFGGPGFEGAYQSFTQGLGIPGPLAFFAIVTELVASVLLIAGALTRLAAIGIIGMMTGAIALVHLPNGFFMNWQGNKAGEGFEFHLLAIFLALVCMLAGGGRASIDRLFMRRRPMEGGSIDDGFVKPTGTA